MVHFYVFENTASGANDAAQIIQTEVIPMKDKSLLGFIVIDLLLAAGVVWGLLNGYKLLGYGLLVYFVINTLAIMLKIAGRNKGDGGNGGNEGDSGDIDGK